MLHPYVFDMSIHHFDLIRPATGPEVRGMFARSRRVPDSPFIRHWRWLRSWISTAACR